MDISKSIPLRQKRSLKVVCGDHIQRFSLAPSATIPSAWQKLIDNIRGCFDIPPNESFQLRYRDEDGDVVTMNSSEGLEEALSHCNGSETLRIVVHNSSKASSQEQEDGEPLGRQEIFRQVRFDTPRPLSDEIPVQQSRGGSDEDEDIPDSQFDVDEFKRKKTASLPETLERQKSRPSPKQEPQPMEVDAQQQQQQQQRWRSDQRGHYKSIRNIPIRSVSDSNRGVEGDGVRARPAATARQGSAMRESRSRQFQRSQRATAPGCEPEVCDSERACEQATSGERLQHRPPYGPRPRYMQRAPQHRPTRPTGLWPRQPASCANHFEPIFLQPARTYEPRSIFW